MRTNQYILCLCFCLAIAFRAHAQVFDDFDRPIGEGTRFCKIVDSLFYESQNKFADVIIIDTTYENTGLHKEWNTERRFWFPGARECKVVETGQGEVFRAVFLAKYTKEELVSSYYNLIHQIQECVPQAYLFEEKHSLISKYYPIYESTLSYNGLGRRSEKPMITFSIVRNWRTQLYELVLEIGTFTTAG